MALDGPALGGEGDVCEEVALQQAGHHVAKVAQVVVPSAPVNQNLLIYSG